MVQYEEEKDMSILDSAKKEETVDCTRKKTSKIPRLKVVNGKVQIDDTDPLQKKWFDEFKK